MLANVSSFHSHLQSFLDEWSQSFPSALVAVLDFSCELTLEAPLVDSSFGSSALLCSCDSHSEAGFLGTQSDCVLSYASLANSSAVRTAAAALTTSSARTTSWVRQQFAAAQSTLSAYTTIVSAMQINITALAAQSEPLVPLMQDWAAVSTSFSTAPFVSSSAAAQSAVTGSAFCPTFAANLSAALQAALANATLDAASSGLAACTDRRASGGYYAYMQSSAGAVCCPSLASNATTATGFISQLQGSGQCCISPVVDSRPTLVRSSNPLLEAADHLTLIKQLSRPFLQSVPFSDNLLTIHAAELRSTYYDTFLPYLASDLRNRSAGLYLNLQQARVSNDLAFKQMAQLQLGLDHYAQIAGLRAHYPVHSVGHHCAGDSGVDGRADGPQRRV